jgi:peptide methionine sulfoxide reductase MsrA
MVRSSRSEDYHQQYLAKNPNGYNCHTATGVKLPLEGWMASVAPIAISE